MKVKKLFAFFMVCIMLASVTLIKVPANNATIKAEAATKTASQLYSEAMNPGWNLGNTFDSVGSQGEESWGNPKVTRELIKTIKDQGFKSIRIPFTVYGRIGGAPNYTIDPTFLARYGEVVKWAEEEGLYVMINIHHDSWNWVYKIGTDDGSAMKEYKAVWTQLSNYFKDSSDKVCFESINEPYFSGKDEATNLTILDQVNNEFYKIVRNSGGKNADRMLIMPTLKTGVSTNICASLLKTIQNLKDANIVATVHYYGFWPFSTNIAGTTTMTSNVTSELEDTFNQVNSQFIANGIGVICGEYGLLGFDKSLGAVEHGEVLKYFEYVNYYAKQKDITMMLWDNGQHMNRKTLQWSDSSLSNMIKTSWTTRSSYANSDRIFITDDAKNKDVSIKLTLNGNTLTDIYNGDKKLAKGTDYTISNDTLTFKSTFIKSVITSSYGINTTVTLKFSAGCDWDIYLTHYKAPVISKGKGNTSSYDIPVKFNGAVLSTIEAVNANGSGVGPNNWTSYKEYDKDFKVDYTNNKLIILNNFWKECPDGVITFKLHFQSGEVLLCKAKKSGSTVTNYAVVPTMKNQSVTVNKGSTMSLAITDLAADAVVTCSSSNKKIATVTTPCKITGVKAGNTTITIKVKQSGKTYTLKVTVKVK